MPRSTGITQLVSNLRDKRRSSLAPFFFIWVAVLALLRIDAAFAQGPADTQTRADSADVMFTGLFRSPLTPPPPGESEPAIPLVQAWTGPRPVRETDRIEGRMGSQFGVLFVPVGGVTRTVNLRQVIHFPEPGMRDPDKAVSDLRQELVFECVMNRACYVGWAFEKPWELVVGRWRIEV